MPMIAELERSCVAMHQAQPKYSHLQPLAPTWALRTGTGE